VSTPRFTIVIPTFNRPRQLHECLEAVCELAAPPGGIEVIVVNDGGESVDVGQFRTRIPLRLVEQANAGPATARNRGSRLAQGEYLAFTDDDCRPEKGWLQAFGEALKRNPTTGGRVHGERTEEQRAEASQALSPICTGTSTGRKARRACSRPTICACRGRGLCRSGDFRRAFDRRQPRTARCATAG
jgi:GT2 family glycosyltransferase